MGHFGQIIEPRISCYTYKMCHFLNALEIPSVDLIDVLYFYSKTGLCSYVTRISCKSFSLLLSSPTFKLFTYFLCLQLKVTDYLVKCSVVSRYAVTTVQSSVWNQLPITKEAAFEVDLPSSAFISNFTITSSGKVYVAQVKERAAARKMYDTAKKQGKTAGLVREIEKFRVAVSVPSGARVSFFLTYEELLQRRLGRYELTLGLRPGQLVQNLTLDVCIRERTGISFLKVLPLRTSQCARVRYTPTLNQQKSISSNGLNVYDGYFVHYFAPRGLPVVPKDVIFVIDVSSSMIGNKIKQTKQAMSTILGDLREGDHFNIITFSDKVHTWKKGKTVRATRQNVWEAKEFVKRIIAEGWTNINAALLSAAQLVNPPSSGPSRRTSSHRVPLVIFLTDGEATIGVTSSETILSNAKKALGSASLFGLAFGDDADFLLLKRLALENRGVARMVYEDADAALQLKDFYDEVASPLLSDIQLSYLDDQAFDVTRSLFPNYFQGSELVVTGRVKTGVKDLKVLVSAIDSKQQMKLENDVFISQENGTTDSLECSGDLEGISSFVHRLWAYFTIKELLLAKLNSTDPATQKLLTDKATNLSLKYNFVTPVTSLVVVKPDEDEILKTAPPPAPGKVSTPLPNAKKPNTPTTTPMLTFTTSLSPPLSSVRTNPAPLPSTARTALPPVKVTLRAENIDGDPHFVVQLAKLHQNLCFTVDGRANDVLRLLEDPERSMQNIIVDGHLMGAPSKDGVEDRLRNYFDQLTISAVTGNSGDIMITLTLDAVVLEGEGRDTLPINQQGSVTRQGVTVTVDNHQSCWIELAEGVQFLVLFHHYKHPSYLQLAHLGFYITDGRGLSDSTQGLLGAYTEASTENEYVVFSHLQNHFKYYTVGYCAQWFKRKLATTFNFHFFRCDISYRKRVVVFSLTSLKKEDNWTSLVFWKMFHLSQ
uniref:Inter-alpha-trypsin inhibitor heavy chain family member 6 n=1 Tax=Astatotilapia calliptera TaxID=8154 RepID=A0AAX7SRA6_ASTCA